MPTPVQLALACLLASCTVLSSAAMCATPGLYPDISDNSATTPQAVSFFNKYFTAKSSDNANALVALFNPNQSVYYDATLGLIVGANYSAIKTFWETYEKEFAENAPNGRSYPLRIFGDTTGGALVYFVNTPKLFGQEIRSLSTFDFVNGLIRRQVDTWDGRNNSVTQKIKTDYPYPEKLGIEGVQELAAPEIKSALRKLNEALSSGNAFDAAALFSYDAIWEDFPLRTRIEGRVNIASYLQLALAKLPYGPGTQLYHVLGSAVSGGYEWMSTDGVLNGVSALTLNCQGEITSFSAMWNAARLDYPTLESLSLAALNSI